MKTYPYDRDAVLAYAHEWAFKRNPSYLDFSDLGGDCTNFCSQCIYAGSRVMNFKPTYGWYYRSSYDRTPSWTGVPFLYDFLIGNRASGPFAREVFPRELKPGDLVQLSFDGDVFKHSLIIVKTGFTPEVYNIRIATHTYDRDNYPLSNYTWKKIRFLHIEGVRKN
jgi:hypothetical protein